MEETELGAKELEQGIETSEQTAARLKAMHQTNQNRETFKTRQKLRLQFRQPEIQELMILLDKEYSNIRHGDCSNPYKKVLIRRLRRKIGRAFSKIDRKVYQKFDAP